jgi:ADP-heptose:LPS heptosyltransferase
MYYDRMRKSKFFGSYKSFLSSILPAHARLSFLGRRVERKYRAPQMVFPYDIGPSRRLLVILPADPLTALHQLTCVVALSSCFRGAHIAVVCEKRVTPFFKGLAGIEEFVEYDREEQYLFSPAFDRIGKKVHAGMYDVCLMLDPAPNLALLYVAGQSAAALRIGLSGAGNYPFLNLHVAPADGRRYLTDRGLCAASVLGVPRRERPGWSVAKESDKEMRTMLQELNIDPGAGLIGIDVPSLAGKFGKKWTLSLVEVLRAKPRVCYFFAWDRPDADMSEWMARQGLPVFADLPVPRAAALLAVSEIVVAGAGVVFELADLLRTPAVGLFTTEEFDSLCRESVTTKGLRIGDRPDEATIASVAQMVDARLAGARLQSQLSGAERGALR